MRKLPALISLAAMLFLKGCVAVALFPWLSPASAVREDGLNGTWYDLKARETLAISSAAGFSYKFIRLEGSSRTDLASATLHRIEGMLLLLVGPADPEETGFATLPAWLLFRAELQDDKLLLYELDLGVLEDELAGSGLLAAEGGSQTSGYILVSAPEKLEAFIRSRAPGGRLFRKEPLYSFARVSSLSLKRP